MYGMVLYMKISANLRVVTLTLIEYARREIILTVLPSFQDCAAMQCSLQTALSMLR